MHYHTQLEDTFLTIFIFVLCVCTSLCVTVDVSEETCRSRFSPSIMQVPGIELRLSGLPAGTFIFRAVQLHPKLSYIVYVTNSKNTK